MATVFGTTGNDSISPTGVTGGVQGNGGDYMPGSDGSDIIDGGGGTNKLDHINLGQSITVSYTGYGSGTMLKSGGAQDSFSTIKRVLGSTLGDTLVGNAAYVDGQ